MLWWPPLSHFKEKRVFFLTSPWFQHLFGITYNFPNTERKELRQGSRQLLPCYSKLLRPPLRSVASLGRLWLGGELEWACKVMDSCIPPSKWQNANPNAENDQGTLSGPLWYLQVLKVHE